MSQSEQRATKGTWLHDYNKLENVSQSEQPWTVTLLRYNYNKLENVSQSELNTLK